MGRGLRSRPEKFLSFSISGGLTFICSIKFIQMILGFFVRGGEANVQEEKKGGKVKVYLRKMGAKQLQPTPLIHGLAQTPGPRGTVWLLPSQKVNICNIGVIFACPETHSPPKVGS